MLKYYEENSLNVAVAHLNGGNHLHRDQSADGLVQAVENDHVRGPKLSYRI
jgi:hypothetical protein